jgi:arginyl-tRNA--protein-N-Asp/Glu arginylyltransferase
MDEERQQPAEPKRAIERLLAIDWDCMDCIIIEEEKNLDIRDRGENADKYWAEGWVLHYAHQMRSDFDVDANGRYHRVYPTRYFVENINITKSMRRVLARNSDLRVVTRPLRITPAKEKLYIAHHVSRFGSLPREPLNKRYQYIVYHVSRLMETCYFLEDELIAFSIFEVGDYSLWSNLGVWSPSHANRSLGTLTVLKEIEYAREHNILIYYMGHYFPSNPPYEYKLRFRPLELYDWDNKRWIPFEAPRTAQMLREPLRRHGDD